MPYPYGMQNSPVVGNGLGGLPRRSAIASASATALGNYDLYSTKKVRLAKVGSTTSLGSIAAQITGFGIPIPMGFGKFSVSTATNTSRVIEYNATGVTLIRANSSTAVSGRNNDNAVFRGENGVGYWYNPSSTVLASVTPNGASGTTQTLVATLSTLVPASGNVTNGGAAYTGLNFISGSTTHVHRYGNNIVVACYATISSALRMILVIVSLSGTLVSVLDLGALSITPSRATLVIYKNIATIFYTTLSTTVTFVVRQINLVTNATNSLTGSTLELPAASFLGFCAYACDGAVWLQTLTSATGGARAGYNYGFVTNSDGLATDHVAVLPAAGGAGTNAYSVNVASNSPNTSFNEMNISGGKWRDFDYNLVYGYSSVSELEAANDIKSFENVLLTNGTWRTKAFARVRAPICFMNSTARLPVALSLVCGSVLDLDSNLMSSPSGYDALLTYLDNGYWVLIATDGDSNVPNYESYMQLYREI